MSNPFSELKTDGKFTLFVNSEEPPFAENPLNVYSYQENYSSIGIAFFRLYRISYEQEKDGVSVIHSLYDWKQIKVKKHCVNGMKQLIDSMMSAIEFLESAID